MEPTFAGRPEAHIDWSCVLETERVQLRPMALSDRDSFGAISFDPEGRRMGMGFIAFANAAGDQETAIAGGGGMTCVYPDD